MAHLAKFSDTSVNLSPKMGAADSKILCHLRIKAVIIAGSI
jgi:hypothetical protein